MSYDYNTIREKMVLPEYGRNIQNMVEHVMSIEDRDERNRAAKTIIAVMGNMNPHLRDVNDFKHKLWDHLAIMSNFELDIDSPYEKPEPEVLFEKPRKVPYNSNRIRYKHYGKSIEMFIEKAIEAEDKDTRRRLVHIIANHMKKSYLTWNREMVNDEQIFLNLRELSGGRLDFEDFQLTETKDILSKNRKKKPPRKK